MPPKPTISKSPFDHINKAIRNLALFVETYCDLTTLNNTALQSWAVYIGEIKKAFESLDLHVNLKDEERKSLPKIKENLRRDTNRFKVKSVALINQAFQEAMLSFGAFDKSLENSLQKLPPKDIDEAKHKEALYNCIENAIIFSDKAAERLKKMLTSLEKLQANVFDETDIEIVHSLKNQIISAKSSMLKASQSYQDMKDSLNK